MAVQNSSASSVAVNGRRKFVQCALFVAMALGYTPTLWQQHFVCFFSILIATTLNALLTVLLSSSEVWITLSVYLDLLTFHVLSCCVTIWYPMMSWKGSIAAFHVLHFCFDKAMADFFRLPFQGAFLIFKITSSTISVAGSKAPTLADYWEDSVKQDGYKFLVGIATLLVVVIAHGVFPDIAQQLTSWRRTQVHPRQSGAVRDEQHAQEGAAESDIPPGKSQAVITPNDHMVTEAGSCTGSREIEPPSGNDDAVVHSGWEEQSVHTLWSVTSSNAAALANSLCASSAVHAMEHSSGADSSSDKCMALPSQISEPVTASINWSSLSLPMQRGRMLNWCRSAQQFFAQELPSLDAEVHAHLEHEVANLYSQMSHQGQGLFCEGQEDYDFFIKFIEQKDQSIERLVSWIAAAYDPNHLPTTQEFAANIAIALGWHLSSTIGSTALVSAADPFSGPLEENTTTVSTVASSYELS